MADKLKFEIGLTDSMGPVLRNIAGELARTEDSMESVRVEGGYLAESLKVAADQIKRSGGSVAEHTRLLKAMREAERAGTGGASAREGTALGRILSDIEAAPVDGPRFSERIEKFKRLKLEWGNFVHSFAGFRREVNQAGEAQWTFNLADGLSSIAGAARTAAGAVFDFGSRLARAVAEAEDLNLATGLQVGTGGAAQLQGIADRFGGGRTRFDDDAIKRGLLPLLRAGVRDTELLANVATAATDIETITAGETKAGEAMAALGKIRLKRDFGEKQIEALGLNADDTFAALATRLGKTGEATKKLVQQGKVGGDVLLDVVLRRLAEQQGGALGQASLEGGKTFGATLQRLEDLPDNLLKSLAGTPAMAGLQQALDNFVQQMQGPLGASVMAALADAFRAAVPAMELLARGLRFLVGGSDEDIRTDALGKRLDLGGGRVVRLSQEDMFDALRRSGLRDVQINDLIATQGEGAARAMALEQIMREEGRRGGEGLAAGLRDSRGEVVDASKELAQSSPDVIQSEWEVHSPSRLFRRFGSFAGEGIALGLEDSERRVSDATAALLSAPASPSASASLTAAGGQRVAHVTIQVADGRGAVEALEDFFGRFFDQVNFSQASPA